MENTATSVSTSAVGVRYGLITGLVTVIISFALNMTGMEQSPAKWLTSIVLIVGIVLAQKFFKQSNGGFMSFGQGLGIGTILSVVVGVLSAISSYIYVTFMDPGFPARILDKTRADMEAQGTMSDAQIEQALSWTAKFLEGPLMAVVVLLMTLLMGFIVSLIISAFTKNSRPEFE